jgi:hypothetical protein
MKDINLEMMDFLSVFNRIITAGEKSNSHYELYGLTAWHDYDGYTCCLAYKDLTLTLLFHGKYSFDYEKKQTMIDFVEKMKKMLTEIKNMSKGK